MELERTYERDEILRMIMAHPDVSQNTRGMAKAALEDVLRGDRGSWDDEDPED